MSPSEPDELLLQKARRIRLLALDVDGILTDGRLYYDAAGGESKAFSTRDGFGLKAVRRFGIELALITGRTSAMVERRARELAIESVFQGSDDKLEVLNRLLGETGLDSESVCYAGDDWPDLPVLARVGLAVTAADAHPEVRRRVHWVTRAKGGHGAVREICDLLLHAQGHDQNLLSELLDR
ncbi:KdsC family phosphatase [Elongatibacter sediminis]|uniref:3-deoxy-D-manno-octulosonate 8-phosphate phosphatase KdsC n=1 Tax=Elongatibacter sediminis TaxID=3119006 RepID=A0AAW9RHI1_9GAMM